MGEFCLFRGHQEVLSAFLEQCEETMEAQVRSLIISVETDYIEGGVHCLSFLCVRVLFFPSQELYSFLYCLFLLDLGRLLFSLPN